METIRPVLPRRISLAPEDAVISRYDAARAILRDIHADRRKSAGQVYDSELGGYRPQRFSSSSIGSTASWDAFDYNPSVRSSTSSWPSTASSPSYLSTPSYKTNVQYPPIALPGSQRSSYGKTPQPKSRCTTPGERAFQRLPPAVYDCILVHLRAFHEDASSLSCSTCYLRDMHSLALVSRKWDRAVRPRLWVDRRDNIMCGY